MTAGRSGSLLFTYALAIPFLMIVLDHLYVEVRKTLILILVLSGVVALYITTIFILFYLPYIMKIYLHNFDPFKPHFYIVKLGFTGVYIIFLISAQKRRLSVPVRTALARQ